MNIEEAIKQSVQEAVEPLREKIDLLMRAIVVQQKDACEIAGVSPDTVRNKATRGEVEILQKDGSRLNYLTLKQTAELRPRKKRK